MIATIMDAKKTIQEKYGVDNYSKTQEYIEKVKNTNNKKYTNPVINLNYSP